LYTRTGDQGETGLLGAKRVSKGSPRVDAYGEIDELSSSIGVAISKSSHGEITTTLKEIQRMLFVAGADLATELPKKGIRDSVIRIDRGQRKTLERRSDEFRSQLPKLANFILPGGTELAAHIHLARAVCRRAERRIVQLAGREKINPEMIPFFNRLSTLLFNLARYANAIEGRKEEIWKG
jgi:cob(I)alamin adenosyltransferase